MMLITNESSSKDIKSTLSNLLKGEKSEAKESGFSALLAKIDLKRNSPLLIQNATETTLGGKESDKSVKAETLLSQLLKESEELEGDTLLDSSESKELPSATQRRGFPTQSREVLELISDAKRYLKEKIESYVKAENIDIEKMPKTLKGLTALAQNLGIEVESVSLETINKSSLKAAEALLKSARSTTVTTPSTQEFVATKTILPMSEQEFKANDKEAKESALKRLLNDEVPSLKSQKSSSTGVKGVAIAQSQEPKGSSENLFDQKSDGVKEGGIKTDQGATAIAKLLQTGAKEREIATEKMDASQEVKAEATARSNSTMAVSKESELVLKVKEAKQFVQHFAQEVKEQIENYKPPFTRLKMQLNPSKLGEVDVTLVQRGNNVHININSNTTAITTLMQHAQELKTQLQNSGVNGATMQFQSGAQHQGGQQQQHRQEQIQQAYEQINSSDEYDTIATALEIIVPRYV